MAKLIFDFSGRQGLAPKHWGDAYLGSIDAPQNRYLGKEGQMAQGVWNPLRRYGYLSGSDNAPTNVTFDGAGNPAPNSIMSCTIYDHFNNDGYFAEQTGEEIYRIDGLADTTAATVHDLGSTGTPVIMDLEIYEMNGARKLYYVYEKSGNLEIGNANLPFASANDDWLTADTSGAFTNALTTRAFIRKADNGFAYIFADNDVHKIDGTSGGGANGTVTADVLNFPGSFQIIDAVDYRGFLYIVVKHDQIDQFGTLSNAQSNTSDIGVYVWDRQSTIINSRDYIPLFGVKEVRRIFVSPQGDLRLFTVSANRVGQIRVYNGSTFVPKITTGYDNFPVYHDSLIVSDLMTFWHANTQNPSAQSVSSIFAYGQITENEEEALFKIFEGSVIDTAGAILYGGDLYTSEGFYLSYVLTSGSAPTVVKWDIFGGGAPNRGDVYTLVKYLPQMSNINYIDFYCRQAGSGSTTLATIKPYFNQSTTPFGEKTIDGDDAARGYKRIEINKPFVNAVQLELEWNTSVTLTGDTDFSPSLAIVDYTPTETKG